MSDPTTPAPPQAATSVKDSIQFDGRGRLVGIDGVLDQVSESLGKQAIKLMPMLSADKELQRTVGKAAGKAAAKEAAPVLWVIAGVLSVIAYQQWKHYQIVRANPVMYDEEPLPLPPPKRPSKPRKAAKR